MAITWSLDRISEIFFRGFGYINEPGGAAFCQTKKRQNNNVPPLRMYIKLIHPSENPPPPARPPGVGAGCFWGVFVGVPGLLRGEAYLSPQKFILLLAHCFFCMARVF